MCEHFSETGNLTDECVRSFSYYGRRTIGVDELSSISSTKEQEQCNLLERRKHDDESLGNGGILAKYAAEGIETYLVTATRGERGWFGDESEYPGLQALGKIREAELLAAASVLGICRVDFLDYIDGDLDQADPAEAIAKIAGLLRRVKPDVVVTFGPDGAYGHPDHIAICQFTTAAIVEAVNPTSLYHRNLALHSVSKLYYMAPTLQLGVAYQAVFGDVVMHVDGVERRGMGWPEWAITTRIDTRDYRQTVWEAILCHESQLMVYRQLEHASQDSQKELWDAQTYYRAFSLVNGGRRVESDLFEGLR
jgi:LmbE family N-acetylglucosaminyl deacetylase